MKEFKYRTEYSINMYLSRYQILQQQDLKFFAEQTISENFLCNIYFILKRPRIIINPGYLKNTDDYVELEFKIQVQNDFVSRFIQIQKIEGKDAIDLKSEYPYKYFEIEFENGFKIISQAGVFLDNVQAFLNDNDPLLDYEVLYIGQSYGEDDKRTVIDRLPSHSTLQAIYSEALNKYPDSEIWLMLAAFNQKNITDVDGRINIKESNEYEDDKRFNKFINPLEMKISKNQIVNFTEAALIQTFKPQFNKDFKNTFPSPVHKSYSECYDLDINGIIVEMDLSEKNRWLYSAEKPRGDIRNNLFKYWQSELFHFINKEDRYKIFNNDYL